MKCLEGCKKSLIYSGGSINYCSNTIHSQCLINSGMLNTSEPALSGLFTQVPEGTIFVAELFEEVVVQIWISYLSL